MKSINKILTVILSILAISFFGCKKEAEKTVEIPIVKITNAEVEFAYKNASDVYGGLKYGYLNYNYDDKLLDNDGYEWYRVTEGGIKTFKDIEPYLKKYFSDKIANEIMNKIHNKKYGIFLKEINGVLYAAPEGRGDDFRNGEETYTYTKVNDYKIIIHVKVKKYVDYDNRDVFSFETFNFVYENLDGKKWVFTSFPYFRWAYLENE